MSLETFETPGDLYLARGDEVNPLRPLFTGDVVADVAVPGVQDGGMAMVVASARRSPPTSWPARAWPAWPRLA